MGRTRDGDGKPGTRPPIRTTGKDKARLEKDRERLQRERDRLKEDRPTGSETAGGPETVCVGAWVAPATKRALFTAI